MPTEKWRKDNPDKVREIRKRNYDKHRQKNIDRAARNKRIKADWLREYRNSGLSCERCGEDHPAALDFHHRDPSEKEIEFSRMYHMNWSIERMMAEIEKCDVLCSNCHRKLHHDMRKCSSVD